MDKKKIGKIMVGVLAVIICGMIYLSGNQRREDPEIVTESFGDTSAAGYEKETSAPEQDAVYIHVCGEVRKPGVYTFSESPRVIDAVKAAGGFTKKADRAGINQAETVPDGTQLTIMAKGKKKAMPPDREESTSSGGKVNINQATREELMTLTGIGEAKADQIITYREENGKFQKIEDIMNISGIKEGVFNNIKEYIMV